MDPGWYSSVSTGLIVPLLVGNAPLAPPRFHLDGMDWFCAVLSKLPAFWSVSMAVNAIKDMRLWRSNTRNNGPFS